MTMIEKAINDVKEEADICARNVERSIALLKKIDALPETSALSIIGVLPYISTFRNSTQLTINVDVAGFTADAAPELAAFLDRLTDTFSGASVISSDFPEDSYRVYSLSFTDGDADIFITVRAHLTSDSACTRVYAGTRKTQRLEYVEVDVPVYKFIC